MMTKIVASAFGLINEEQTQWPLSFALPIQSNQPESLPGTNTKPNCCCCCCLISSRSGSGNCANWNQFRPKLGRRLTVRTVFLSLTLVVVVVLLVANQISSTPVIIILDEIIATTTTTTGDLFVHLNRANSRRRWWRRLI